MTDQWQELKETIIELRDGDGTGTQQEVCKFLVNYMGILEKQMQEPCKNIIDRQAVLDIVDSYSESQSNVEDVTQDIISDIIALPSVNSQPKTGHWMIDEDSTDRFFAIYECSCCKRAIIVPHDVMKAVYKDYPFCHCGAKMVDSQKSEG